MDVSALAANINTQALINRTLSNENLCEIFLTLALLDIPSLERPQGWFLQVNGVCRRWRRVAVDYAELWAISAGSFPSDDMTDLAISRARGCPLRFDGHFEDHRGPGYVLTEYQLSLIEKHRDRLRSFVHDEYLDWSELLYRLRTFPRLEMARIWDDSGPEMWYADKLIDAPHLHGLYMNNVVIPFKAPALRYLRVDMDHHNWSSSRTIFDSYEAQGCEAIPRLFPTCEFIALLKRSPGLERLVITDMPLLLAEHLPSVSELHVELSRLRMLHLGGKSLAMGDFFRRLIMPQSTNVYIDTDITITETDRIEPVLRNVVRECMQSAMYDSFRLGLTHSHDILMQCWSSKASGLLGGLDFDTSLGSGSSLSSSSGPAFTLRLPSVTRDLIKSDTFAELPDGAHGDYRDSLCAFDLAVAKKFYKRVGQILDSVPNGFPKFKILDFTDAPWDGEIKYSSGGIDIISDSHKIVHKSWASHYIVNWSVLRRLSEQTRSYHITPYVEELTIVDFPCAAFPSQKRYDERVNEMAWDQLRVCLEVRQELEGAPLSLRLAESYSDMSNMARSEEPAYVHTIAGSYEDAVRSVTQKGYDRVSTYLRSFEDLRDHTGPQ